MKNADPRYTALIEEYPVILGNFLEGRGIECAAGWLDIIGEGCAQLKRFAQLTHMKIEIGLIKSKFGNMCIQGVRADGEELWATVDVNHKIVNAIVGQIELRSTTTCYVCGEYGRQDPDAAYCATLCREHHNDRNTQIGACLHCCFDWML